MTVITESFEVCVRSSRDSRGRRRRNCAGYHAAPPRSNRLVFESLEQRGMLSVTVGSLADDLAVESETAVGEPVFAEIAAETVDWSAGLPSGVSLSLSRPYWGWSDFEVAEIAPTDEEPVIAECFVGETFTGFGDFGDPELCVYPVPELVWCEVPGYELIDPVLPPDFEMVTGEPEGIDFEPEIHVDPVFEEPPTIDLPEVVDETVDPVTEIIDETAEGEGAPGEPELVVEPVDYRVQFVSSDPGWAAYHYMVGVDGSVVSLTVVASYDDPTIAAFVADHVDDPAVQISDYGGGWCVVGFPLELAPPVPENGVFEYGDAETKDVNGETLTMVRDEPGGDLGGVVWSTDDRLRTLGVAPVAVAAGAGDVSVIDTASAFTVADAVVTRFSANPVPLAVQAGGEFHAMRAMAAAAPWFGIQGGEAEAAKLFGGKRRSR